MSFKDIEGFNGKYQISDTGVVRSFAPTGKSKDWRVNPKIISLCTDARGYLNFTVHTGIPHERKVLVIHREVAKAFIPNPQNYKLVRHLNDIKTDNRAVNLAWGTHKENRQDGIRNGTQFHMPGVRAAQRKLDESIVSKIFKSPKNNSEIGREYGVTESTISKIRVGRTWNKVTKLPVLK